MLNARLDESQTEIKFVQRNISYTQMIIPLWQKVKKN